VPDGRIPGAQAIGLVGVEKRIDVIATAIQLRGTVHDLAARISIAESVGRVYDVSGIQCGRSEAMKVRLKPASRQGVHYRTPIPDPFRYRRIMKIIPMATLALTAGLFLAPAGAQQVTPKAPEHTMPMPQSGGMKSGGMMNQDNMMADMKAADARLEALAQTMKSASGDDKVRAMQELMTELVQNQVDMHRQMSMMREQMMSQMPHK
jgi:hypothetical protein